jgi:cell division protein FtsB
MKKIFKDKRVIVVVVAIVLVMLLLNFNQRMVLLSRLRDQENDLTQKYAQLEATRDTLKTELAYANSDEAVEAWARQEGGMIQQGDIPIVLLPASNAVPTSVPTPESFIDEIEKWEIWQELFFGE